MGVAAAMSRAWYGRKNVRSDGADDCGDEGGDDDCGDEGGDDDCGDEGGDDDVDGMSCDENDSD